MEPDDIKKWLETVKRALLFEKFKDTPFQTQKPNQAFGLVKDLDDVWQMHVRGYKDATLESEIEPRRWFLEHLDPTYRRSFIDEQLTKTLDRHNIQYRLVGDPMKSIDLKLEPPKSFTDWRILLIIVGFGLALYAFSKREKEAKRDSSQT